MSDGVDATDFESTLTVLADYSNFGAIFVIIICLASMVVFILRLNIEQMNMKRKPSNPGSDIPAQLMTGIHNPFSFHLKDDGISSTLSGGVNGVISSQVPCLVQAFWGVTISEVYPEIYAKWDDFHRNFIDNSLFKCISFSTGDKFIIDPCNKKLVEFIVRDNDAPLDLGPIPRPQYPLVVCIVCDTSTQEPPEGTILCMVNIVHASDDVCPGKSHIITQLVRSSEGQPYTLQQLYVASSDGTSTADDAQSQSDRSEASAAGSAAGSDVCGDVCIVCQLEQINRVVMPCRHACVCDACFLKLDKCPMCRAPIYTYFTLDGRMDGADTDSEDDLSEMSWWARLNTRVNNMMGLT